MPMLLQWHFNQLHCNSHSFTEPLTFTGFALFNRNWTDRELDRSGERGQRRWSLFIILHKENIKWTKSVLNISDPWSYFYLSCCCCFCSSAISQLEQIIKELNGGLFHLIESCTFFNKVSFPSSCSTSSTTASYDQFTIFNIKSPALSTLSANLHWLYIGKILISRSDFHEFLSYPQTVEEFRQGGKELKS